MNLVFVAQVRNINIAAVLYKKKNKDNIIAKIIPPIKNIFFLEVNKWSAVIFFALRSLKFSRSLIKPFSLPILRNLFFL